MPDASFVKLKYVSELINFTTPTGSAQVFAMNGLFDPNITGVGHQPLGFDQWMNFYQSYEVMASKVTVIPTNDSQITCDMALYPSETATALSINNAKEQPYSRYLQINRYSNNSAASTMVSYMKVRKFEGRTTASINYTGNVSNNPANTRYWVLVAAAQDGFGALNLNCSVEIIYYARFFKRISLATS